MDFPSNEYQDSIPGSVSHVSPVGQIYHLEIPEDEIFINILIQITDLLPELSTLKIRSLLLHEPRDACVEEH